MSTLIIHHGYPCKDGFCSAWVLRKKYPDAEFVSGTYDSTDPRPDVTGRDVIIVDFSYDRDTLLQMKEEANSLIVLDHHASAEKELKGLHFCIFDMDKSGARLAWEYCFGDEPSHWLVDYTEDRDLWNWTLPDTKVVNAALQCFRHDFEVWDEIGEMALEDFLKTETAIGARAVVIYEEKRIEDIIYHAQEIEMAGHKVLCANSSVLPSEVGGVLAKDRPFGVVRHQLGDGRWKYSLRSREGGIDVSEIAALFGGGGHPQAAGCTIEHDSMDEVNPNGNA